MKKRFWFFVVAFFVYFEIYMRNVEWMREDGWLSADFDMDEIESAADELILYAKAITILLGGTIHPDFLET